MIAPAGCSARPGACVSAGAGAVPGGSVGLSPEVAAVLACAHAVLDPRRAAAAAGAPIA
jgi:hypothetical protein